jgi:predicted DsbA family dithiol-disulfide isomerase
MDTQIVRPEIVRPALELDLIADFACPWSYLGKRSLERALGSLHGLPVRAMRWHGFRPQSEPAGAAAVTWPEHLAIRLPRGVTVDYAQRGLAEAGRELGIGFDFAPLQSLPDTREAHRLTGLAMRDERQNEVVDALFRAFFEQGRDIGDVKVLGEIARDAGLSTATLSAFADPAEGRDQVIAEEQRLRGLGVVATPNLLINGRVLVPGPADVPTYIQALDHALFPALAEPQDKRLLH